MKQKNYRFRRFIAFAIDWNLSCLPTMVLAKAMIPWIEAGAHPLIMLPVILVFPVLFLNRDRLLQGRSPGNRLMGLTVLDSRTLLPLTGKGLVIRNLFFLLGGVDMIALVFTGCTLGDRAAAALVVPLNQIPEEPPQCAPRDIKTVMKKILTGVLCFALFVGIIFTALETVKDEPHYAAAYEYLIRSQAFIRLEAEPEDALLTGFSRNSTIRNGTAETSASFTFLVKGRQLEVVCHLRDGNWYVCEDCTHFE